jgi:hypothetical protein
MNQGGPILLGSWDKLADIKIGYLLDDRGVGVRFPVGSRIFFSSCGEDRFWGPYSLLAKGYQGLVPQTQSYLA